jgi:hypothetical protein
MSIYVYVTRKPDPLEDEGPDISEQEWIEVIKSDPDLAIVDPPDRRPRDRQTYAVWNSYPGGYPAWFALGAGSIEVKGLDDALLAKLRYFATKLNARIVSEMGEEFS